MEENESWYRYNDTRLKNFLQDKSITATKQSQGVAALLIMFGALCFIFAYCCWGAPFCRSLCKKYCCCRLEDPEPDQRLQRNNEQGLVATPTIILLPHGRMLVVDGTIFTQFQADANGLDLVELGESVIRAQRNPRRTQNSQASILDMDTESKESFGSIGCFPPPTYDSIYGKEENDMPPSYSEILLPYDYEKEDLEIDCLRNNRLPYPSFSSQSFPMRNISRNPSIISNPVNDYYMSNELEYYQLGMSSISDINRDRGRSYEDIRRRDTDSEEDTGNFGALADIRESRV